VAVAYEGLCTFEFGIVVEVFALPRPELQVPWYRFRVCSLERGPVTAMGGITVRASSGLGALTHAGTVVIPGWRNADERPPEALLKGIERAYRQGARVVSICSGVFVLAAAGILDGKRVTTHWRYAERLAQRFPRIRVEPDVLYIDEGRILTSAGSAAGIDLCLHIVRGDYGAEIANQVARRLVVPPHREGGQSQYVTSPLNTQPVHGLARLLEWTQHHLDRPLTVQDLARKAVMSPRSLARHFLAATGTTPHRWLTHQRLMAAQRRLETTEESIDQIAQAVGMQTAETLRHHFRERFQTTPTTYRRRFTTTAAGASAASGAGGWLKARVPIATHLRRR
jgi:AraC family transcriptional regulator, transcriptional activator FtrA